MLSQDDEERSKIQSKRGLDYQWFRLGKDKRITLAWALLFSAMAGEIRQTKGNMEKTKLMVEDGRLSIPFEAISDRLQKEWADGNSILLLCRYDAGDCDTIQWPDPDEENLRSALYDAREMGQIPNCQAVLLPDGREFNIDY